MKPIKTPEQHADALKRIDRLVSRGEHLTPSEQDTLEVLALLIEQYEKETQPVPPPTPVEAIKFRMEQMNYRPKDLAVLLGGASRASEILSGKRGLTPEMMRRLRDEWGIPADSLLGAPEPEGPVPPPPGGRPARNPKDYPMKQMCEHGYFRIRPDEWRNHSRHSEVLLGDFFLSAAHGRRQPALARQGGGAHAKINPHAVEAWQQRVLTRVSAEKSGLPPFHAAALDVGFLRWLTGLTGLAEGPRLVCDALEEKGIAVIIQARLDGTFLDGAAMLGNDGRPLIALTLRHDRLDNFWFTLFHELGHVLLHLSAEHPALFDSEIDLKKTGAVEIEADRFALDTLIPPDRWAQLRHLEYANEIRVAAASLRLHPALIAGRLRREANDYRKHRTLIGTRQARAAFGFTEDNWPK